ncbi:MAG: hypothetical protein ACK5JH_13530 [Anaerocolumna sp.]
MSKLILKVLLQAIIIFAIIPFMGVTFLPSDWGFPFLLLTLYILNPIFFIYSGMLTGKKIKNNWLIPLYSFLIFLIFTRLIYGTVEPVIVIINVVACGISILLTLLIEKRKKSFENYEHNVK